MNSVGTAFTYFPIAFPNLCFGCWGIGMDNGANEEGSEMMIGVQSLSQNSVLFSINRCAGSDATGSESGWIRFFAIGY